MRCIRNVFSFLLLMLWAFSSVAFAGSSLYIVGEDGDPEYVYQGELTPGSVYSGTMVVQNGNAGEGEIVNVKLYAADAVLNPQGDPSFDGADQPVDGAGAWVVLSDTLIENLEPDTAESFDFIITVPEDATLGKHVLGIAAEDFVDSSVQSGGGIAVIGRQVIGFHITVVEGEPTEINVEGAVSSDSASGADDGGDNYWGYGALVLVIVVIWVWALSGKNGKKK